MGDDNNLQEEEEEDNKHLPESDVSETTDDGKSADPPQNAMVGEPKTAHELKRPLKPFNYDAVMLIDEWERWLNTFKSCSRVATIYPITDEEKISALLDELGPKGKELLESFKTNPSSSLTAAAARDRQDGAQSNQHTVASDQNDIRVDAKTCDLTKFDDVIWAFTTYFVSKSARNLVYERFKFNTFNWLFGQPLKDYIKVLRRAAVRCDFLEMDSMIRDRLLLQVRDIALLESLLKIKDLTLEKAIEMCQEHEEKDYKHNPAAQRPPPESESAAKRRRKRKRKAAESMGAAVESNAEPQKDSGAEVNFNKCHDTAKLRPSKKKRHRWAKALQNVKQAMQG